MFLFDGGMIIRRFGFRLFILRLLLFGGGGDFVGMILFKLFVLVFLIKFGEVFEFINLFFGKGKNSCLLICKELLK